jgi:hypothetical protein
MKTTKTKQVQGGKRIRIQCETVPMTADRYILARSVVLAVHKGKR